MELVGDGWEVGGSSGWSGRVGSSSAGSRSSSILLRSFGRQGGEGRYYDPP
jgi:hypothetical protein